jgi:hypothetical protein
MRDILDSMGEELANIPGSGHAQFTNIALCCWFVSQVLTDLINGKRCVCQITDLLRGTQQTHALHV